MEARFPDGRTIPFNLNKSNSIGRGATADVFFATVGDKRFAAKIYKSEHKFDVNKISNMTRLEDFSNNSTFTFAWPTALIVEFGRTVGYLMPLFDKGDYYPLNYYFDATLFSKLNNLNILSLPNRIEIAASLCAAIAALHDRSVYFIDLKPQNILINWKKNAVAVLDCDGFCVRLADGTIFPAGHISTDYIAPEVTRQNLSPAVLAAPQDNYALAVILFQLFNYAQHPFQGVPVEESNRPFTNDELAAAGLFACAINLNPRIQPRTGSTHTCMPTELRLLFDRSFIGPSGSRVSANEWCSYFSEVLSEKRLKRCDRFPTEASHIYFKDGSCPECNRAAFKPKSAPTKPTPQRPSSPMSRIYVPSGGGTQAPMPLPKKSSSTGRWIWGVVITLAVLYFIGLLNANQSSTQSNQKTPVVTQSTTVVPAGNPTDYSKTDPASHISFGDIVKEDFQKSASGNSGNLRTFTVYLNFNQNVVSLKNPAIYILYNTCYPSKAEISKVQTELIKRGYKIGFVDGVVGSATKKALRSFQISEKITTTGELDPVTAERLGVWVLPYDLSRYKYHERGSVFSTAAGPKIVFYRVKSEQFCYFVTKY